MDLTLNALIIAGVFNILLSAIIFIHGPKRRADISYAVAVSGVVLWIVAIAALRISTSPAAMFLSLATSYAAAVVIAASFWYFVKFFIEKPIYQIQHALVIGVGAITGLLAFFSSDFIRGIADLGNGAKQLSIGPVHLLFVAYFSAVMFRAFQTLYRKYRESSEAEERVQISTLSAGVLATTVLGSWFNITLVLFGNSAYIGWGPVTTIIMVAFIGYSIARHNLMNVRVIGAELFTMLLLITLAAELVFAPNPLSRAINAITLVFAIGFGALLIRSVIREVRSREQISNLATELSRANVALKQLDQAKSEFISIAGHQLRAPLTIIKGYVSMLLEGTLGQTPKLVRESMAKVATSAEQLVRLVGDLLDLSRIEAGRLRYEFTCIPLTDIIAEVVREFEATARARGLILLYQDRAAGQAVNGDPDKLREVVVNLVDNAIRYTAAGRVVVELYPERQGERRWLTLKVQDTGIGIKAPDAARMFTKFARTEEARRLRPDGMGLGLYIVKKIVEDHGGRVAVSSPGLGQGSTFSITLPAL